MRSNNPEAAQGKEVMLQTWQEHLGGVMTKLKVDLP